MTQHEKLTEAEMAYLRSLIPEPTAEEALARVEERQRRERKEAFAEFLVELGLVALIIVSALIAAGVIR